jgi:hypothetical protein
MTKDLVTITATQRFMELLSSINHEIAYRLIEEIKYRHRAPISFLDFGDTNDTISFVYGAKVKELMNEYNDEYREMGWKMKRSSMKIGKMIKSMYDCSFPINQPKGVPAPKPPIDIESFVNMFKAEKDKNKNYERFELVSGKDIKFWYNQANYSRFIQEDTTLAKSCLRYEESGKLLEMYVNNPKCVKMLILKDDVNRLRGRALVWNLTEPEGRVYLERIYTINDYDVELYKNYAREQGWLYKSRQTYGYQHPIIDGTNGNEYYWENFTMKVQLDVKPVNYFPYLDTLCVYNTETGILSNDGRLLRIAPHIKLTDAQGSFIDEVDYREMVFSRFYNEQIARESSIFIELDQDWVYEDDVVYVNNSGGKRAYKNSPLVCKSDINGKRKFFLKDDCVYSDYLSTWIYKDSVKEAYSDSSKEHKVLIHKRLIGSFFEVDGDGDLIKKKIDPASKRESQGLGRLLRSGSSSGRSTINYNTDSLYFDYNPRYDDRWSLVNPERDNYEDTEEDVDQNNFNPRRESDNNVDLDNLFSQPPNRGGIAPRRRPNRNEPSRISDDWLQNIQFRPSFNTDELIGHVFNGQVDNNIVFTSNENSVTLRGRPVSTSSETPTTSGTESSDDGPEVDPW